LNGCPENDAVKNRWLNMKAQDGEIPPWPFAKLRMSRMSKEQASNVARGGARACNESAAKPAGAGEEKGRSNANGISPPHTAPCGCGSR
jgi:hypothetical protein